MSQHGKLKLERLAFTRVSSMLNMRTGHSCNSDLFGREKEFMLLQQLEISQQTQTLRIQRFPDALILGSPSPAETPGWCLYDHPTDLAGNECEVGGQRPSGVVHLVVV